MNRLEKQLFRLGFAAGQDSLFTKQRLPRRTHPYFSEISRLLRFGNSNRLVEGVFCVDEVPAVWLLDGGELTVGAQYTDPDLERFFERAWNQNLARVAIVFTEERATLFCLGRKIKEDFDAERLSEELPISAGKFATGQVAISLHEFFEPDLRVDRQLLENIYALIEALVEKGLNGNVARLLVARTLLVSYLEHRGIVGEAYRNKHRLTPYQALVDSRDRSGLRRLFERLKLDFNGDFLGAQDVADASWSDIPDPALDDLSEFLKSTDLVGGQRALFERYDFSEIPVELISGIYEKFLDAKDFEEKQRARSKDATKPSKKISLRKSIGAYYTPRLLAELTVEQAFAGAKDLRKELVYDGACGSGILLVTAFRKIIAFAEASCGNALSFNERVELLKQCIRGGDIDRDACRLTALSLYLALFADLSPADLQVIREQGGAKLPNLMGSIIKVEVEGDFFTDQACHKPMPTILVSNPPWVEPPKSKVTNADSWAAKKKDVNIPRRQLAYAFALRAAEVMAPNSRVTMILPMTGITNNGGTNWLFRRDLLARFQMERIVNYADLRRLIFGDSAHPFVVLTARVRAIEEREGQIELRQFQYDAPKSDLSLALGRIALHGIDRKIISESEMLSDQARLLVHYWGDDQDAQLLDRLRAWGTLKDLVDDKRSGWKVKSGFHATDGSKSVEVPSWMARIQFLDAKNMPESSPLLPSGVLRKLQRDAIAAVPPKWVFSGPRVLFTDGAHGVRLKAVYVDKDFSFQHSVNAVVGPKNEAGTLKFLAAYMRSTFGRYLLTMQCASVIGERQGIQHQDLKEWPFVRPENHPRPNEARSIIEKVSAIFESHAQEQEELLARSYDFYKEEVDSLVFDYFMLTAQERVLVEDVVDTFVPAIQPATASPFQLNGPTQRDADSKDLAKYGQVLAKELAEWSKGCRFEYSANLDTSNCLGSISIAVGNPVAQVSQQKRQLTEVTDAAAVALNRVIKNHSPEVQLALPDIWFSDGKALVLIRPLKARFWLRRQAVIDAEDIVQFIKINQIRGGMNAGQPH